MKRSITTILTVSSLAVLGVSVRAQGADVWDRFLSPSGNIFCEVIGFTDRAPAMVKLSCGNKSVERQTATKTQQLRADLGKRVLRRGSR